MVIVTITWKSKNISSEFRCEDYQIIHESRLLILQNKKGGWEQVINLNEVTIVYFEYKEEKK
jgi:hypothetical protein